MADGLELLAAAIPVDAEGVPEDLRFTLPPGVMKDVQGHVALSIGFAFRRSQPSVLSVHEQPAEHDHEGAACFAHDGPVAFYQHRERSFAIEAGAAQSAPSSHNLRTAVVT